MISWVEVLQRVASWPRTGLTDDQVGLLAQHRRLFDAWRQAHGLGATAPEAMEVMDRGFDVLERQENEAPPANPRRADSEALWEFTKKAVRLAPRQQLVFDLCVRQGLSLTACAERLGISRETVRVHLRRLRGKMRVAEARQLRTTQLRPPALAR